MSKVEKSLVVAFMAFAVAMLVVSVTIGQEAAREMIVPILPLFLMAFAGLMILGRFVSQKLDEYHKVRGQETANRKRWQLFDQQENIGNRIFNALLTVCAADTSHKLKIERIKENGNLGYSIIIGWKENSSFTLGGTEYRGYPVAQINVHLFRDPAINVAYGPYPNPKHGTDLDFGATDSDVADVISKVGNRIVEYSFGKRMM